MVPQEPLEHASGGGDRLDQVLAAYFIALEQGANISEEQLMAAHPELADGLREFFADRQRFTRAAGAMARPGPEVSDSGELPVPVGVVARGRADDPTVNPNAAPTPREPRRVRYFGEYELLQEIARGGMGVVYRARQVSLRRIVALKMILVGQFANEEDVRRFHAEAQAAARLEHPNIVPIFEIGQHDGQHYFTMAYVEGESLAHRVARGVLSPREAARLVAKTARAIAFAHAEGVVHRDLKPANILIDLQGEPRVTDFGLAKRVGAAETEATHAAPMTATGQVLGTPGYMPPEQAAGNLAQVGPLADVYALGAVLYCLLAGRPPFQAASPIDTILQVIEREPVSPRALNSQVPRDLETICLKCLEKEPAARYQCAAQLADDLERFVRDEPILARPIGWLEKGFRLARKNSRAVRLAATVTVATLLASLGLLWGWKLYGQARSGLLQLETTGQTLSAEIRDEHDRLVADPFTAPTPQPVSLPRGEYNMRLSAPGLPSQTSRVSIHKGTNEFAVGLTDRLPWKPISLEEPSAVGLLNLGSRTDLVLIERRIGQLTIRRVDGRNGTALWEVNLNRSPAVTAAQNSAEWASLLGALADGVNAVDPPALLDPAPDLNADGQPDLVWVLRNSTLLVVQSGADGQILWWSMSRLAPECGVVGMPLVLDVDADERPDLVATFRAQDALWIEAIRGTDGQTLWKFNVDAAWLAHNSAARAARNVPQNSQGRFALPAAGLSRVGDRVIVALATATHLVTLVPATGVPLLPGTPLKDLLPEGGEQAGRLAASSHLLQQPRLVDCNGDGSDDVLLFHEEQAFGRALTCISLAPAKLLWQVPISVDGGASAAVPGDFRAADLEAAEPPIVNWPFVTRQTDTSGPSILVPCTLPGGPAHLTQRNPRFGVALLDGATGKTRWAKALYSAGRQTPQFRQILEVPDLDRDGHTELIVCSTGPFAEREWRQMALYVDLLSARTGERLGGWHQLGVEGVGPGFTSSRHFHGAALGQPGADGWPELLVMTVARQYFKRDLAAVHVVSLANGTSHSSILDVARVQALELNGDGLPDLLLRRAAPEGDRLQAILGTPPELWRRLGQLKPTIDFDADGLRDLIEMPPAGALARGGEFPVVSARTGRRIRTVRLTQSDGTAESVRGTTFSEAPLGDLDGDGLPELLVGAPAARNRNAAPRLGQSIELPLRAVRSGDGSTLWNGPPVVVDDQVLSQVHSQLQSLQASPRCEDLDGDGAPEVLCPYVLRWLGQPDALQQCCLAVVDGRGGTLRWNARAGEPVAWPYVVQTQAMLVQPCRDLNADGTRDLILSVKTSNDSADPAGRIEARDGRDGTLLWHHALAVHPDVAIISERPSHLVLEDLEADGRPEVVFLDAASIESGWVTSWDLVVLDARDGTPRWKQRIEGFCSEGHVAVPIPVVARLRPGSASICVPTVAQNQLGVTVVGADGGVERRFAIWKKLLLPLLAADADGDGVDELIYWQDSKLRAGDGADRQLWEWPAREPLGALDQLELIGPDEPGQRRLLVRSGTSLFELELATGNAVRRAEILSEDRTYRFPLQAVAWWLPADRAGFVAVAVSQTRAVVARSALPVDSEGRYRRGAAAANVAAPALADDPRWTVHLSWYHPSARWDPWLLPRDLFLAAAIYILPLACLVMVARHRRQVSARGIVLVAAALMAVWIWQFLIWPGLLYESTEPTWRVVVDGLLGVCLALWPALVVRRAWQRRWGSFGLLSALFILAVAAALSIAAVMAVSGGDEPQRLSWQQWWQSLLIAQLLAGAIGAALCVPRLVARLRRR